MTRAMPYPLMRQWLAYDQLEPIGETRADLRAGIIASTIANVQRSKGAAAYKPGDFMPKFAQPPQSQSDMFAQVRAAMMAGKNNKRALN